MMNALSSLLAYTEYNHYYSLHCKHLKLQGLQPKTIEAYSRAIRRIAAYFNGHLDDLSQDQLLDYFHDLLDRLSWSAVKLDLYGLKFFYTHVLAKPWVDIPMIKPPRCTRIPDIVTVAEAQQLFMCKRLFSPPRQTSPITFPMRIEGSEVTTLITGVVVLFSALAASSNKANPADSLKGR
jgi:site-specific recombinase XerD